MMTYATMTSHQPVRKPVRPSSATEVANDEGERSKAIFHLIALETPTV